MKMPIANFVHNLFNYKKEENPVVKHNREKCEDFIRKYELVAALAGYELIDITDPGRRTSCEEMSMYETCRILTESK